MGATVRSDLFVRLARYRPSPERESLEDFLTELIREVLSLEPEALNAFLALSEIPVEDAAEWSVRSQAVVPCGRLDLLLQRRSGGSTLIVESKLAAPIDERQLRVYLDYAAECERKTGQAWRVALVTRGLFTGVIHDVHFTRAFRWFQVADALAAIREPRYPYLVEGTLEFMREKNMGPIDPFDPAELGSYRTWKSFERKVDNLLGRLEAQIRVPQPVEGLEWKPMDSPSIKGKGIGWSWPTHIRVAARSFWYYLGFQFDSTRWFIGLTADYEPEAVVAIGLWADRSKVAELAKLVNNVLESKGTILSAAGFQVVETDGQAVILLRRLPLTEIVHTPDHTAGLLRFFTESHRRLVDSGVLAGIAVAFRERFGAAPVPPRGDDSPETQPGP